MAASTSFADNATYLELGSESSEEDAMNQWHQLLSGNQDVLGNLEFHPETVIQSGNRVTTRLHAGPVATKSDAQKLCAKLFSRGVACFVLEGQLESPVAASASPLHAMGNNEPHTPVTLPWLAQPENAPQNAAASAAPEEKSGFFSWLFGSDSADKAQPAPTSPASQTNSAQTNAAQANVDVAEAIHVPLSDNASTTGFSTAAAPATSMAATPSATDYDNTGWLNVDSFASEEDAAEFWQNVRSMVPARAAGMRVRMVRPLLARAESGLTVNIGPFASMNDANNFCRDGVVPVSNSLRCSFVPGEPSRIANAPELRYAPNRDYNARRQMLLQQQHSSASYQSSIPQQQLAQTKQFWVQLASGRSQMEAMQLWKNIQSGNADLLRGLNSRVSTALTGKTTYNVRVGPLQSNNDAMQLCTTLQQRNVACKIYASM